jgi:hypothetical protein
MRRGTVAAAFVAVTATAATFEFWPAGMSIRAQDLLGTWQKSSDAECAAIYPSRFTFEASGIYRAPEGVAEGAIWHGGDWEVREAERLAVQLANDRMDEYEVLSVTQAELRIRDKDGCNVEFARV